MVAAGAARSVRPLGARYHRRNAQAPDLVARLPRHRRARSTGFAAAPSPSRTRRNPLRARRRSRGRASPQARRVADGGGPRRAGAPAGDGRGAAGRRARAGPRCARRHARRREGASRVADPSETTQVSVEPDGAETSELLGAVRALSAQVGGLQAELHALRSQVRPLPEPADAPGWGDSPPARRESSPWVRTLERPGPRGPAVPRLLIEIAVSRSGRARSRDRGARPAGHRRSSWRERGRSSRSPSGSQHGTRDAMARTGGATVRRGRVLRGRPVLVRPSRRAHCNRGRRGGRRLEGTFASTRRRLRSRQTA